MEEDLFTSAAGTSPYVPGAGPGGPAAPDARAPLAVRMRPRSLDEVLGQDHLLTPGSPLRRLVDPAAAEAGPPGLLLWGPPGTGKTTLATLASSAAGRRFVELSATTAGVKEVRQVIDGARRTIGAGGPQTVLFIDEVHRFSKSQQDALLPGVENRWVTFIGATTENPYFSVISALLSRCLLLTLEPLSEQDVRTLLRRALVEEHGLGGAIRLGEGVEEHLLRIAGGDARRGLTALEAGAGAARSLGRDVLDVATLEQSVDRAALRYDKDGDQHYDVVSAFIKSVRGSDVDAALHYLARMVQAGEDPRYIARRLVVLASEDVGMADPSALGVAVAGAQAVQLIGMPEARINLAQVVVHLALAPKSNAVITAVDAALSDVRQGLAGPVPPALRDSHYAGASALSHGAGYRYAHDEPHAVAVQQYAPDAVTGRDYYRPTAYGQERELRDRLSRVRRILRGG